MGDLGGGPSAGVVVGVAVVAPWGDQQVHAVQPLAELGDELLVVVGQVPVGQLEDARRSAGEQLRRGVHFISSQVGELRAGVGGGVGVGGLAEGRGDDLDLRPALPQGRDQPAGAEGLVIRVGGQHHGPPDACQDLGPEPGQRRPAGGVEPVLFGSARVLMAELAHQATCGFASRERPSAASSRSAWHWRR